MTMEAEFFPEMLLTTYQSTRCHDPEYSLNIDSCFYKFFVHGQDDSTVKPRAVQFANEVSDTQCIVADEIIQWAVTCQNQIIAVVIAGNELQLKVFSLGI
jgi:hypothetical protein